MRAAVGHCTDVPAFFVPLRCAKKNKLFLNVQINGNGFEDSPSRSPHRSARTPGVSTPAPAPYTLPGTPTLMEEHSSHLKSEYKYILTYPI